MELTLKTSVLEYTDEIINNGVIVYIAIDIEIFTFLSIIWINKEGDYYLECEPDFLKVFGASKNTDIPFYTELCNDIISIVDKEEINKIFNI